MKKKILLLILVIASLFMIAGCGKEEKKDEPKDTDVMKAEHVSIDGAYVDESFEDENLAILYLFYTVDSKNDNLELASSTISIKINDNEYSANVSKDLIPKYTNYAYSDFIKKVYVGKTYKICSTYKVAKGDLEGDREIKLSTYKINGVDAVHFKVSKVQKMENLDKISEALDKNVYTEKYNKEQETMSKVDSTTLKKVRNAINGYIYSGYVNVGNSLSKLTMEFSKPNKFKVKMGALSNSGTYDIRKGALILNYKTGKSVTVLYEYKNNSVEFTNFNDVFGTYTDYDPLKEK